MSKLYSPLSYSRPEFRDCPLTLDILDNPGWVCELKQDGLWGNGICVSGKMTIYSLGYGPKGIIDMDTNFTGVLAGEYMYGSNWAARHGEIGMFHVFDILAFERVDLRNMSYLRRRTILEYIFERGQVKHPMVQLVQSYPADTREYLWSEYVEAHDYEGLVYKHVNESFNDCQWFRTKKMFSLEYVCMGYAEGQGRNKGRVGSIIGGVYKDGVLTSVCYVGGGLSDMQRQAMWDNKAAWVGKVFTAVGYKVFPSGALRHPSIKEWREDKKAEDCTFEKLMDVHLAYS